MLKPPIADPSLGRFDVLKATDIIARLDVIAPPRLADDGDRIGLQVGDPEKKISRILVVVDPTDDAIDHAVNQQADLIISHHPLIFNPLRNVSSGDPIAEVVIKLIKSDIALYVMHTNFDIAKGGVNDALAERLDIEVTGSLATRNCDRKYKIAVFTPVEAVESLINAMTDAGAGGVGDYSHCSFRSSGTGTFKPLPGANPYIGTVGQLEEVPEFKLETLVSEDRLQDVIGAMLNAHPYEEAAYDIYPLENEFDDCGLGRVGELRVPSTLSEFRKMIEERLEFAHTRVSGDPDRRVKTVAICGGSGRSLLPNALKSGADVYVTGDFGHHDHLTAGSHGLAVIDAGHCATESPGMQSLAEILAREFADVEVESLRQRFTF